MKKFTPILLGLIALITTTTVSAQDSTKTFTLSGSVDAYFHSSFGTTNGYYDGAHAPSTSFADLKGFSLGMVNLIGSYQGERTGFTADLVFGPRGQAAVFGTASGQAIINQLLAYYKFSDVVTLNMGQFNTFLGYEVISPAVNFHYSTSYLFSWGPFNHTGLRADFTFGGGWNMKLAVMNPTDIVEFNPVDTYTLGLQVGHTGDAGGIWFNALLGDQDGTLDEQLSDDVTSSAGLLTQGDITLGFNLSENFYLGVNTSLQSVAAGQYYDELEGSIKDASGDASSFFGVAVYPKVTLSESFALGLRAEYFAIKNGHLGSYDPDLGYSSIIGLDENGDGDVMEFTLSGNLKSGGLTFIPEFRVDMTSEDSFLDGDGKATSMLPSVNLAAVYKF
jgi:hypothetical protein